MTTAEKIAIMQASEAGTIIEFRAVEGLQVFFPKNWTLCTDPKWNWGTAEYRIKPEPRSVWANEYSDGEIAYHSTKEKAMRAQQSHCLRLTEFVEKIK